MYKPTFKEYYGLLAGIFSDIILKHKHIKIAAIVSAISVFVSTYYVTELAEASAVLLEKNNPIKFSTRIYNFGRISAISLALRHIPLAYFTYLIQYISRDKFVEVLRSYMSLSFYKFHKKTPGEIRFTVFLKALAYPICVQIVVFDFTTLLGTTIFTFIKTYNDINMYAAFIFSFFPIIYIWYMIIFLKYRIIYRTLNLVEQEKTSSKIYDKLSNYDVIKAYNLENSEIDSLRTSIKGQVDTQMATDIFTAKGKYVGRFLIISPYILLAVIFLISPGAMTGSLFFQATLLYSSLSIQIKKLGVQLVKLSSFLNQIGYDTIDKEMMRESQLKLEHFQDKIEFANVDLFHEEKLILKGINCKIFKGEKIAVVGTNGCGKSTFIKSILGFTYFTGEIFIDGIDIKNLSSKSVFSLISYISQDDYTSDDTIMNNIKLGNKSVSDETIKEKAKFLGCHDMIMSLDNGYETQAGIKGSRLSGGQRQKLSMVRAAVKDAPIFILDEATSAIDKGYEAMVLDVILNKLKDKTVVMIIHEKAYLSSFDRIIFLNKGQLEDSGKFEDLLQKNKNFKDFMENTDKVCLKENSV